MRFFFGLKPKLSNYDSYEQRGFFVTIYACTVTLKFCQINNGFL